MISKKLDQNYMVYRVSGTTIKSNTIYVVYIGIGQYLKPYLNFLFTSQV